MREYRPIQADRGKKLLIFSSFSSLPLTMFVYIQQETLPNGWLGFKLSGPRWEKTRYCAVCRKAVPGLDHHCTW
jgi:hypothetical protein